MNQLAPLELPNQPVLQNTFQQDLGYEYFSRLSSHDMIYATLYTFCHSGIVEIRCVGVDGHGKRIDSGYFSDFQKAAEAVQPYVNDGSTRGVYFSLNPVAPGLIARASNRIKPWASDTTADADITRRTWLFIDCDPVRPSGISATDEQVQRSYQRAIEIGTWLMQLGIPTPTWAMSGNGSHLAVPISLPNDQDSLELVRGVLRTLDAKFTDVHVKIDTSVYNASRICRLYGTIARKGDLLPTNPHRMAQLFYVPGYIARRSGAFCAPEALRALAAMSEPQKQIQTSTSISAFNGRSSKLIVGKFLHYVGIEFKESLGKDGNYTKFVLEACPFNPDHKSPDSMVTQHADGAPGFKCLHDSCSEYKWQAFVQKVGEPKPDHYDPPNSLLCRSFAGKSAAELWPLADQPVEWLVEGLFSVDQPTIIGAKQKSLKTTLMSDLAVSLASGTPWLGTFQVPRKLRVLFITGEASPAAAIRKIKRAAEHRNLRFEDFADSLRIEAITFPNLPSLADCEAIARAVEEYNIDVVIIDPLYMGLQGVNTANLTEVGPAMRQFMEHCRPASCIIVHHVKKTALYDDAPNLEDLSQAGIAEFAGNYWLMGRMGEYTGDGLHSLAVRYGGRDEQFGLLNLEFDENNWTTKISGLLDHRKVKSAKKETEKIDQQMASIIGHLNRHSGQASISKLAEAAGTKTLREPFQKLIDELCKSGQYERFPMKGGNNKECEGLRVKGQMPTDGVL